MKYLKVLALTFTLLNTQVMANDATCIELMVMNDQIAELDEKIETFDVAEKLQDKLMQVRHFDEWTDVVDKQYTDEKGDTKYYLDTDEQMIFTLSNILFNSEEEKSNELANTNMAIIGTFGAMFAATAIFKKVEKTNYKKSQKLRYALKEFISAEKAANKGKIVTLRKALIASGLFTTLYLITKSYMVHSELNGIRDRFELIREIDAKLPQKHQLEEQREGLINLVEQIEIKSTSECAY